MKHSLILFIVLVVLADIVFAEVTVSGYAFLENETNHSGIMIEFTAKSPSSITDTAYTSSDGKYSIGLSAGMYEIKFIKEGFLSYTYPEIPTFSVTTALDDVNLETAGISGSVSGIWTRDKVYVIKGDITIEEGDTLIIEAGVQVKLKNTKINVYGLLIAQGSELDSIYFTSYYNPKNPGDWKGIYFYDKSNDNSILSYCVVEYGGDGESWTESLIYCEHSNPTIEYCRIHKSSYRGILCYIRNSVYSDTQPKILNCTISNNSGTDIECHGSNPIIKQNNINKISIYYYSTPIIENNSVRYIWTTDWVNNDCKIVDNDILVEINCRSYSHPLIRNNKFIGGQIQCNEYSYPLIENNIISEDTFSGITIWSHAHPKIINNTIYNCGQSGISGPYDADGAVEIMNNIICGNTKGISNISSNSTISYNLFWDNKEGNFDNISIQSIGELIALNANGDSSDIYYNIQEDPSFVDSDNGDFHLSDYSRCIGAGTLDGISETDFDGNPRPNPVGSKPDIGAYENPFGVPQNAPPSIISEPITDAIEDFLYSYDVDAIDINGDALIYSLSVKPVGMTINSTTGEISWLPNNENVGDTTVTVKVTDESSASDTQTYILTVLNVNDPPVFSILPDKNINEDEPLSIAISYFYDYVNDPDNSDNTLTFTFIGQDNISVTTSADSVRLSSPLNWNGSDTLDVIVSDGNLSDTTSWKITVNPVNDAPVITTNELTNAIEDQAYSYTIEALDADLVYGDHLIYSLSVYPEGMTINITFGEISWLPDNNDVGDTTVTVSVSDDSIATDTKSYILTVVNVNNPPILYAIPDTNFNEDTVLEIPLAFWYDYVEDVDNDDSELIWTFFEGDSVVVNASTDNVKFSAPLNWYGVDTIKIAVSDGQYSDTSLLALTVYPMNDPPIISNIPDQVVAISDTIEILLNQYVSDTDLPNDNISWSYSGGVNLLITLVDSIARITNKTGWIGTESVLFIAKDDSMSCDSSWVNFNVIPIYSPRNLSAKSGLTYVPIIWNKPGPQIEEIIYDDGSYNGSLGGFAGCKAANHFTPPWPCKIIAFKFYQYNSTSFTFRPGIYSWNGTSPGEVLKEFNCTIDKSGWTYIDVSGYDIIVNGDFVISHGWLNYYPTIGYDDDDKGRSWFLNPSYSSNWESCSDTYYIRAIVEKIPGGRQNSTSLSHNSSTDAKEQSELSNYEESNYGKDISYYKVYRSDISGSSYELIESRVGDTTYIDTNVELGKTYFYVVTSVYSEPSVESEYSNETAATTAFPPVLSLIPDTSFFEDDSLHFPVAILQNYVQDEDTYKDSLHWIISQNQNVFFNFEKDSVFISSESNWFGKDTVLLIVSDGFLSDSIYWIITVHPINDTPFFTELMPDSILFNSNVSDTLKLIGLASDVDNPDSSLIWSYINSSFVLCQINDTIKTAIFWVEENLSGQDTIVLSVSDGELAVYDSLIVVVSPVTGIEYLTSQIPKEYSLKQNYPNPFNPVTNIIYGIPKQSHVNVKIYDLLGREVITLVYQDQEAKYYNILWDAKDKNGNNVPSGMYLYRIVASSNDKVYVKTKKLLLLR